MALPPAHLSVGSPLAMLPKKGRAGSAAAQGVLKKVKIFSCVGQPHQQATAQPAGIARKRRVAFGKWKGKG